jgi:hypothetical protein
MNMAGGFPAIFCFYSVRCVVLGGVLPNGGGNVSLRYKE